MCATPRLPTLDRSHVYRTATLAMAALTVALLIAGVWLWILQRDVAVVADVPDPAGWFAGIQVFSASCWLGASLVLLRRPELGFPPTCAAAALGHALGLASYEWATRVYVVDGASVGGSTAGWLLTWVLPFEVLPLNWIAVALPDGRLPSGGRIRKLAIVSLAATFVGLAAGVITRPDLGGTDFTAAHNPLWGGVSLPELITPALLGPTAVTVPIVLWVRWRGCTGDLRIAMRRMVVVVLAGMIIPTLFLARADIAAGVAQVVGALQILTMITIVLRHRLFGIDTVLERTLRYVLLVGALLAVYVGLVAAGDALLGREIGPFAAVAVALVALPLHRVLSEAVARFVYGERDRPERVVDLVTRRASVAASPQEMLRDVVGEVAEGLRIPRLVVIDPTGSRLVELGVDTARTVERFELVHRGRAVGSLEAQPRAGEDRLADADRHALRTIAAHLAPMVDGVVQAVALRDSRDRLVHVREDERRRLRRDLHDGLGPVLTGVALSTDAARNLLRADPDAAVELLGRARVDLGAAIADIRRLVENLRPPSLDELGLVRAIDQHSTRFPHLSVEVSGVDGLDSLPAAVEVAAYRIATEALTNVARHSNATTARVDVSLNGALQVRILDDGHGRAPWTPGVGLTSMAERVSELGGTLHAGPDEKGRGCVVAVLPVEP